MLAEGQPLEEAARFGSAAAALTTTRLGAQDALPSREAVVALLREADPSLSVAARSSRAPRSPRP